MGTGHLRPILGCCVILVRPLWALASSSQIYLPGKRCTKVLKPGDSVTVSSIIFHVDDYYVNIIMWGHGTGFTLSLSALPGPWRPGSSVGSVSCGHQEQWGKGADSLQGRPSWSCCWAHWVTCSPVSPCHPCLSLADTSYAVRAWSLGQFSKFKYHATGQWYLANFSFSQRLGALLVPVVFLT